MNKYLKYKQKYLELKGGSFQTTRTFYIYTTGIAEWGDLGNTFNYWQEVIIHRMCQLIPPSFASIIIIHCDILQELNLENQHKIQEEINAKLVRDLTADRRIRVSEFQKEPLNFEEIHFRTRYPNQYIVLDLAHIFSYVSPSEVKNSGHYGEEDSLPIQLNCVYPGYVGQDQVDGDTKMSTRYIVDADFIKIDPNTGKITTFITNLFNTERFSSLIDDEPTYPNERINKIMKKIRAKIVKIFKDKYGSFYKFDSIFTSENKQIHQLMVKIIIDQIINSELTEDEIIEYVIQKILQLVN